MPLTLVNQTNFASAGTAIDQFVTIPQPAAGNLLIILLSSDSNLDAANPCYTSDGANGNIVNLTQKVTGINNTRVSIFSKIASGSNETRAHVKNAVAVATCFVALEYSGQGSGDPFDASSSNTGAAYPATSGISGTTAQGDELALMCVGNDTSASAEFSAPTNQGGGSLSPTWTLLANLAATVSGSQTLGVASAPLSAVGTLNGQFSGSGVNPHWTCCLATFAAFVAQSGARRSRAPGFRWYRWYAQIMAGRYQD